MNALKPNVPIARLAETFKDASLVHPDAKTIAATITFRLITRHISGRKFDAITASVAAAITTYKATSNTWANGKSR
jgi:hypothetical protein